MRSSQGLALVAYGPISADQWKLERLRPRAIREDEVLVRIVASGVCHADLQFGNIESEKATGGPAWYPRVLGHEGEPSRKPSFCHIACQTW